MNNIVVYHDEISAESPFTLLIIGSMLVHREIAAVNLKLPDAEQISLSFMYPGKMQKIKAQYKRLYRTGKVENWRVRFQIAMFAFLALPQSS